MMYDTDAAGILYFGSQFRLFHDAFETFFNESGVTFNDLLKTKDYLFVIAHAESDYLAPVFVGDSLDVQIQVSRLGQTSFTLSYQIYRESDLVGKGDTVHVCLDKSTKKTKQIPQNVRDYLRPYQD